MNAFMKIGMSQKQEQKCTRKECLFLMPIWTQP